MAKSTGMGGALWVDEFILSNDIQSVDVSGGPAPLDVTGIDKSAHERLGGLRDGSMALTAFFNTTAGQAHPVLSALPTTDTILTYAVRASAVGDSAASIIAKQVNYDGTRAADGMLTFSVDAQSAQEGVTWGKLGTAGVIDVTTTGDQASIDNGAASTDGLRAFIHVTEFTGTNATVLIEESSDDGGGDAFATIASFTSVTGVGAEAISVAGAVERYLRVAVTVDNFTSMSFVVNVCRQ